MKNGLMALIRYWWPAKVDIGQWGPRLARFYSEREDYHEMTSHDKISDPQVQLLLSLLSPGDKVVEFGCGGGSVLSAVGEKVAEATGFDIGEIALRIARGRPGRHRVFKADISNVPIRSGYADVVFSTEVLEHVWDPAAALREMIRVLRPGGLILMTTPHGYAMNLHLGLRPVVRLINHVGAFSSLITSGLRSAPYENIPPDLDADPVYPDCDMITRIHPRSLVRFATAEGCDVERMETFFFQQAKAPGEEVRVHYADLEKHPFYHWFGDHILFVARKRLKP